MLNETMNTPERDPSQILLPALLAAIAEKHPEVLEAMKKNIEEKFQAIPEKLQFAARPTWKNFFQQLGIELQL